MNKNEQINKNQNRIIAFSIFAIAMMLTIIPFPEFITHYMPDWGLMALIFLSINLPKEFNLSTAFFIGLITDVIKGTILGQHTLSSLIIVFATTKYHLQLRSFTKIQLLANVLLLSILYHFILFWVNGVAGVSSSLESYWAPIIGNFIAWPIINEILSKYFIYNTPKKEV